VEPAQPLNSIRTQLCVIITGYDSSSLEREQIWTEAAEEFLRRMHKLGVQITIIGPRPMQKFGTKRTIRWYDRHEVIAMKLLASSKSHRIEFRILNKKMRAWTRLRAESCVVFGPHGVWPVPYPGWTLPGTLTLEALSRWMNEVKWIPGREFTFLGSANRAVRMAGMLLDRGAKTCYIVEEGNTTKCWRAYHDRFVAKGGRILVQHKLQSILPEGPARLQLRLGNDQGTLLLNTDTVVLSPTNDDVLNAPDKWKSGLFYVARRRTPWDTAIDEEPWFEKLDWRELYWRVGRFLKVVDYSEAEGALKTLKAERRNLLDYRTKSAKKGSIPFVGYSGKILDRDTMAAVQTSVSTPKSFDTPKPMASLECFEHIPCRACADACPEAAIDIPLLTDLPRLLAERCTGCGACVAACPPGVAVMVKELPVEQKARYFLPDDSKELWKEGTALHLLNRRGDPLGQGRVVASTAYEGGLHRMLEIESTNVHMWEARNYRVPKGEFAEEASAAARSPTNLKRGWVHINGVRRLCPVDVPLTVALWQLGQRRFEDAFFCHDGSCRLCEVEINGKPALACREIVHEGHEITINQAKPWKQQDEPLCPCKGVLTQDLQELRAEGVPEKLCQELTGLGQGTCHGRWCLNSRTMSSTPEKPRPIFHGFESSPWRDVWASDVVDLGDSPVGRPGVERVEEVGDEDDE